MPRWRLRFLGPPAFERDGQPVDIRRPKLVMLLAYLALARGPQGRAELARLFWPNLDTDAGFASLRLSLLRLRACLGEGLIVADRRTVRLEPGIAWVDVEHFLRLLDPARLHTSSAEALGDAVALYRGELLMGIALRDGGELDAWQALQAERLRAHLRAGLDRLVSLRTAAGRTTDAIAAALHLTRADPLYEPGHRALMELYARSGRRAEALAHHAVLAALLREQVGAEPEEETQLLRDAIEAGPLPPASDAPSSRPAPLLPSRVVELPAATTRFVGRLHELASAEQRLDDPACRLLTITGPGGAGKTALALELARRRAPRYRDGACFVLLANVTDPTMIASAILDVLHVPPGAGPPEERLWHYLRDRRMLLVADNVEHLLDGAAVFAGIASRAHGVQQIITSREPLDVRGEWEMSLDGLPCDGDDPAKSDAVALFVETAARGDPGFALSPENVAAVVRVCRVVGGLPLGIELAAARVRGASPAALAAQLERDLGALSGPRDAPERQRSLRASFAYSYRRLSPDDRAALRRLSVFCGPATAAAVQAVTGAKPRSLSTLAERFLVRRRDGDRFELHAVIRQFAAEELAADPGDRARTEERHAEHHTALIEVHGRELDGPGRRSALAAVEPVLSDVRSALRWSAARGRLDLIRRALDGFAAAEERLGHFVEAKKLLAALDPDIRRAGGDPVLLGRILVHRAAFSLEAGGLDTAAERLGEGVRLLSAAEAAAELGAAQLVAGRLALRRGDLGAARWSLRVSLALARPRGDRRTTAEALRGLGAAALQQGDGAKARRLLGRALAHARTLGDDRGTAASLEWLGAALAFEGDLTRAEAVLRDGLAASRAAFDPACTASILARLGGVLLRRRAGAEARRRFAESRRLAEVMQHPGGIAAALHGLGLSEQAGGNGGEAARLLREALDLREQAGERAGVAESQTALGLALAATGDAPRAHAYVKAALRTALEAGALPLALDALVGLVEIGEPMARSPALRRALAAIGAHPAASHATRDRAGALLPPPASVRGVEPVEGLAEVPALVTTVLRALAGRSAHEREARSREMPHPAARRDADGAPPTGRPARKKHAETTRDAHAGRPAARAAGRKT